MGSRVDFCGAKADCEAGNAVLVGGGMFQPTGTRWTVRENHPTNVDPHWNVTALVGNDLTDDNVAGPSPACPSIPAGCALTTYAICADLTP